MNRISVQELQQTELKWPRALIILQQHGVKHVGDFYWVKFITQEL